MASKIGVRLLICVALAMSASVSAASDRSLSRYFRVAVLTSGPGHWKVNALHRALQKSLAARGWRERVYFPPELQLDGRFDPGRCRELANGLLDRDDVDLILAYGPRAALALIESGVKTPIIALLVPDPLSLGLSRSIVDSGRENLTCTVFPQRVEFQLRLFHRIFGFKRLGLIYDPVRHCHHESAVKAARSLGRRLGFSVLVASANGDNDRRATAGDLIGAARWLAPRVDAFFLGSWTPIGFDRAPELAAVFTKRRIPTFAQDGAPFVAAGMLMGTTTADMAPRGRWLAKKVIRILSGDSPRSLPQVFLEPAALAVNLDTARAIGWHPPVEVMDLVTEVYSNRGAPGPNANPAGGGR